MTVVHVLGTHGVPAAYGGFETAAQEVGLFLRDRGWDVVVYCQLPGEGPTTQDEWRGLTRVNIREPREGWRGTAAFDLTCVRHVLAHAGPDDVCLTFGYNTGVFNVAQRLRGIPNVINMDGMEWTRRRWGLATQGILLGNERMAGLVGDVLIADHPVISDYLRRHFGSSPRPDHHLRRPHRRRRTDGAGRGRSGLTPGAFATMICRPIPENSCLEIVRAWSARSRGIPLVVLGDYQPDDPYHRAVQAAAGDEVRFLGAVLRPGRRGLPATALRGSTSTGTPWAAPTRRSSRRWRRATRWSRDDNVYNTWVAGEGALYFGDEAELDAHLGAALDPDVGRRLGDARAGTVRGRVHLGADRHPVRTGTAAGDGPTRTTTRGQDAGMTRIALVGLGKMGLSHLSLVRPRRTSTWWVSATPPGTSSTSSASTPGCRRTPTTPRCCVTATPDAVIVATPTHLHAADGPRGARARHPRVLREAARARPGGGRGARAARPGEGAGHPGRLPQPLRRLVPRGQAAARPRRDRHGAWRPRRGLRPGRRAQAGRPLLAQSRRGSGGGCLYDYAAHPLDLLTWYLGDPESVVGSPPHQHLLRRDRRRRRRHAAYADATASSSSTGRTSRSAR